MLIFSTHNQIANQFNPVREQRLLCNTTDDEYLEQADQLRQVEGMNMGNREELLQAAGVGQKLGGIRSEVNQQALLVQQSNLIDMTSSPTVVRTILDSVLANDDSVAYLNQRVELALESNTFELQTGERLPRPGMGFSHRIILRYLEESDQGERDLQEIARNVLLHTDSAIMAAKHLERRLQDIRNAEQILEARYGLVVGELDLDRLEHFMYEYLEPRNITLRDFIAGRNTDPSNSRHPEEEFDNRMSEQEMLGVLNSWLGLTGTPNEIHTGAQLPEAEEQTPLEYLDENLDQGVQRIEPNPEKQGRTLLERVMGMDRSAMRGEDDDNGANIGSQIGGRAQLSESMAQSADAAMKKRWHGRDLGLEKSSNTREHLEGELLKLKQAIDNTLQSQARVLRDDRLERFEKRFVESNLYQSKDAQDLYNVYGITHSQLWRDVYSNSLALPQRILRETDPELDSQGVPQDSAPDVSSDNYLLYAEQAQAALEQERAEEQQIIAAAARGEGDADFYYEDTYLKEAQEENKQLIEWAQARAPQLRELTERMDSGELNGPLQILQSSLQGQQRPLGNIDGNTLIEGSDVNDLPKMLTDLSQLADGLAQGGISAQQLDELSRSIDPQDLKRIDQTIEFLSDPLAQHQFDSFTKRQQQRPSLENTEQQRSVQWERLRTVREQLRDHPEMDHELLNVFPVFRQGLTKMFGEVEGWLTAAEHHQYNPRYQERGTAYLNQAVDALERFEDTLTALNSIRVEHISDTEFKQRFGGGNAAYVRRGTLQGTIFINADDVNHLSPEEYDKLIAYEKGHALMDIFTSTDGLFSAVPIKFYSAVQSEVPAGQPVGSEKSIGQMLQSLAEPWGVNRWADSLRESLAQEYDDPIALDAAFDAEYQRRLVDMLLSKYAMWRSNNKQPYRTWSELERQLLPLLFAHLERSEMVLNAEVTSNPPDLEEKDIADVLYNTGEATSEDLVREIKSRDVDDDEVNGRDLSRDFREMSKRIEKIQVFYQSYPEYKGQLEGVHLHYEKLYKMAFDAYSKGGQSGGENFENVIRGIDAINKNLVPLSDELRTIASTRMNLNDEKASGRKGWRTIFDDVTMLSIMDYVEIVKQGWEDLNRVWKRRGAAKQAAVGEALTDWISDKVPYAGRLKHEYAKRSNSSELEEVNQWKEALKDADSWALQDQLRTSRNKDQIRAIFELLSERGRLDWNDEGMWATLSALSIFDMPVYACRNNDILRDRWLQKIITQIYGDKEHYFNWRQSNDSAIQSGTQKFTPTADQLSNLPGGLAAGCSSMLKQWVEAGGKRGGSNIPEDINPHLYEELIFYSIRNGKMTMEQKFYFLVRGIAERLISIDRLRVIAGEGGGILNTFPFIDYFYGRNNTFPEVEALSDRLTEKDNPYEPGTKTTLFVRMELAREESVKQRLRKGVSKLGDKIDHDDTPYFIPEMDYSGIDEWFNAIQGSSQKLSKEALKNGYVGYNMKFRTFGGLAELDANGVKRFSQADVRDMAQTIGAYVLADGLLTRNIFDRDDSSRPMLSRSEIYNQIPVYADDAYVGNYRETARNFVSEIVAEYLPDSDTDVWNAINEAGEVSDGTTTTGDEMKAVRLTGKDFGGTDYNENRTSAKGRKAHKAMGEFVTQLEDAILRNPGFLKNLLRKYSKDEGKYKPGKAYEDHRTFLNDAVADKGETTSGAILGRYRADDVLRQFG